MLYSITLHSCYAYMHICNIISYTTAYSQYHFFYYYIFAIIFLILNTKRYFFFVAMFAITLLFSAGKRNKISQSKSCFGQ